ncbi:hypothetical protein CHGG_02436 [Chaetomium globosum CBS 148.51]|uniref:ATP-dependent DNA helicase n=1 Tax=Chaetomium globosum (strain ATCC 6205 / CBS 148.51 / DSM 1962 / NBRC 6347 / NRRL 1970) TaxID=306901 RepID=Q2HBG8_CHAGB|nr:uncharacterized protein CHGG_02436 [Chaetomium globosum CBS 148.51]EAQ90501.1 hypothetical protein CHGG_02436 [Chaetomium globosum CBS 148.51]
MENTSHVLCHLSHFVQPDLEDDEGRAEFARCWGFSITAMNPEPNRVMMQGEANVLIIELFEHEQPTFDTLSRIVNRVQRHACSEAYCLRRKKLPGGVLSIEPACRFYFPRRHHEEAYVTRDMNPAYWMFDGARNDSRLNGYNRTITLGWLANTDINPCTSVDAVLNYVAKYCSKAETKSKSYQELARELLPRISNRNPLVTMIRPENQAVSVRSQYQKYLERLELWDDITYFDFLSNIDWSRGPQSWRRIRRAKPRVLNYFPRYKSDPGAADNQFEDFCRVKLMLNHVHRNPEDLKTVDGSVFDTYRQAYEYCLEIHRHPDDYYGEVFVPEAEDVFEDAPDEELQPRDWEELAAELPNRPVEQEDIDILGNRDIDILHLWEPHSHYKAYLAGDNPDPILLQVDGRGGTGKSHVIRPLSARLDQLARARGYSSPVVRAAPTGVAANNIAGSTLHSLLRLPVSKKGDINNLNATELGNLQAKLKDVLYFIIDEKSLIGLRLLASISYRMGEIWPRYRDQPFGGRSVQWRLLSTRAQAALSLEEVRSFDDALRIYPRNSQVNDYNLTHLEGLNLPCYQAVADNTGPKASEVEAADAGNLHKKIPLVIGARVMLTENICIDKGLVNGCIGTIYDFAWRTGADISTQPPFVVLIKFDQYVGPPCFDDPELAGVVPIFRSKRDFLRGNTNCTRTQFPLTIAYAITVHKSQGATLDRAVLDISDRDFTAGLTYVAISRVKTLQGVMFDSTFDLQALRIQANANHATRA